MRLLLIPDPASPNGEDAFCREIAKRAHARGHLCVASSDCDAVIINGLQPAALLAARTAGRPTALRLIDSFSGVSPAALAEIKDCAGQAGCLLVPSRHMAEVVASWGVAPQRCRIVPYAYDHIFAQQIALVTMRAARPSGFGLVTAGSINASTLPAFETMLSAVSRLRLDCHLAVIGDGPALSELRARAETLSLGGRVSFVADLPHPKKMEYLRAAKAFIEPSSGQGFPALVLHALSEGCPVIGAAGGCVSEIIVDGRNGLLFRPGDAADLSEQVVTLASTPGLSLKLIAEGVRTVERHSWDATVAATFDAVETLQVKA
ncbi:MAG: glycosyltransferase [Elusimicrobiota bacterium]